MIINLTRTKFTENYTEGVLSIDAIGFRCETIEPPYKHIKSRADKLPNGTAIPFGKYRVVLAHSPRFRKVLPRLLDVTFFEGILIHSGNTAEDTRGCIIVGHKDGEGHVSMSRYVLQELMFKIEKEEVIYIFISNRNA